MVIPITTLDFSNVLSEFFVNGGGMSQSLRAEVLRKGALSSLLKTPAVIPPWELPPSPDISPLERRAIKGENLINKKDPLFERDDLKADDKVLFAVFKALNRLGDMAAPEVPNACVCPERASHASVSVNEAPTPTSSYEK